MSCPSVKYVTDNKIYYNNKKNNDNNISENVHRPTVNIYNCSTDVEQSPTNINSDIDFNFEGLFDVFWSMYPRKEHKKQARELWAKLPGTQDFFKMLMISLKHRISFLSWDDIDKKYIPLPDTWLKDERWKDEMTETDEV